MTRMDTDTVPLALSATSIIGGERPQNIYESWDESPGYKSSMGWAFWIQIEYKIKNHLKIGPVQPSSKAKNKGDDAVKLLVKVHIRPEGRPEIWKYGEVDLH